MTRVDEILLAVRSADDARAFEVLCTTTAESFDVSGAALPVIGTSGYEGLLAASDAAAGSLEELQFTLGEGPSLDAHRTGRTVDVTSLDDTDHWPAFTPTALRMGCRAMLAAPVRSGAASFGVLSLHRGAVGPWSVDEQVDLGRIAGAATELIVTQMATTPSQGFLPAAFDAMIDHRAVVHQAAGMVSVQLDLPIADALVALRAHAFQTGRTLGSVSEAIVAGTERLGPEPS